jgi:adenine-specific DNA-methyltransferase
MEKLDGKSMDIVAENIERLKEIFPDVFTEGKVDFEALEATLGEYVEGKEERYSFNWNGKAAARRIAQTPSTGTLRPAPDESKNWDSTENLYIEGDNLEVLKLMQKSYHKQVKMIYIDPPYNTGKEFIYPDNYQDNLNTYLEYTGQKDGEGRKFSTNVETSGRYHSSWLNMMYPRLKLARNLLKDDGVIFISIGEEEIANLEQIANEVFGEENKISLITRIAKTASNLGKHFAPSTDFILCYSKNINFINEFTDEVDESLYKKTESSGSRKGEKYRDDIALYQSSQKDLRKNQKYFIECPDGSKVIPPCKVLDEVQREGEGRWRWIKQTALENKDLLVFKKTKTSPLLDENGDRAKWNIYTKSYLNDRKETGTRPRNILDKFINRKGADYLKKLDIPFDFSKPYELIEYLLKISNISDNDIVLDFFSGSATSAESTMQLNAKDNIFRKFIMIQLPEEIDEKSEAYKAGYKNICEIGKERIRRAGEKIKEENAEKEGIENLDIGFKVFKLDSSNIKAWDPQSDNLEQNLWDSVENIKSDRTSEDLMYEILLKYGLDLTLPIEELTLAGKKVYVVGLGALVICLDEAITLDTVEAIAALKEKYESDDLMRVVFRDNGFKNAEVKTNAIQILKQSGIDDVKSL